MQIKYRKPVTNGILMLACNNSSVRKTKWCLVGRITPNPGITQLRPVLYPHCLLLSACIIMYFYMHQLALRFNRSAATPGIRRLT